LGAAFRNDVLLREKQDKPLKPKTTALSGKKEDIQRDHLIYEDDVSTLWAVI